jgi:group I intron endonuclease
MVGIYRIRNKINNKCYYGSANNIKKRWCKHKSQLNHNRHENIVLQRAWNKCGIENFEFEVVEICNKNELLIIEQNYLDLKPKYNIGKQASGGDNLSNHPNRNDIINNRKNNIRRKIDEMSDDDKKKIWSRPNKNNGRWKGGVSINYCICGKKITPEHKYCNKCLPRNGENNPFFNKHHTEKTKKNLSDQRKGKYCGNQNIKFMINNIEYFSLGNAYNKLGIPIPTILWRLKSKNKKFNNYKYVG